MILGLDVSTTCTGLAVIDKSGKMVETYSVDTKKQEMFENHYSRASLVLAYLKKIKREHNIEHVFIEDKLMVFMDGKSKAKTLSTLAFYNGIISWICFDTFNLNPVHINPISARSRVLGKIVRDGKDPKKRVIEYILDNEPSFVVSYTRQGNYAAGVSDMADALVIAKAGLSILREGEEKEKE